MKKMTYGIIFFMAVLILSYMVLDINVYAEETNDNETIVENSNNQYSCYVEDGDYTMIITIIDEVNATISDKDTGEYIDAKYEAFGNVYEFYVSNEELGEWTLTAKLDEETHTFIPTEAEEIENPVEEETLTQGDKEYIEQQAIYYLKLIFEFIASLTGSGFSVLIFWKILKTIRQGIELKLNKDNLSKEEQEKKLKENNDILIEQIKEFKSAMSEFETIKSQNITLCNTLQKQNKLIAKLVAINPVLASNGEATEILNLLDNKDGVDNDSEDEINNI